MVARGEALLAPTATRRLIQAFARQTANVPAVSAGGASDTAAARERMHRLLTGRELEVLGLVAAGLTNTEIGERLTVSTGTVKTHIGHLLAKLGARDRVQLVIQAFRAGLA